MRICKSLALILMLTQLCACASLGLPKRGAEDQARYKAQAQVAACETLVADYAALLKTATDAQLAGYQPLETRIDAAMTAARDAEKAAMDWNDGGAATFAGLYDTATAKYDTVKAALKRAGEAQE